MTVLQSVYNPYLQTVFCRLPYSLLFTIIADFIYLSSDLVCCLGHIEAIPTTTGPLCCINFSICSSRSTSFQTCLPLCMPLPPIINITILASDVHVIVSNKSDAWHTNRLIYYISGCKSSYASKVFDIRNL